MEEKETFHIEKHKRYGYIESPDNEIADEYDSVIDKYNNCEYVSKFELYELLNQQDKHIKELQANNEILKTSKSHFKKVAENVVDLLGKLNKFIGEPQTRELNYCKVIEDTKSYIEKLKQSQKQLAISVLEEVNGLLTDTIIEVTENEFNTDKLCYLEEISSKFSEKIKNKIKKY